MTSFATRGDTYAPSGEAADERDGAMQQTKSTAQEAAEDIFFGQIVINWARWFVIAAAAVLIVGTSDDAGQLVLGILPVIGLMVVNFYLHGRRLARTARKRRARLAGERARCRSDHRGRVRRRGLWWRGAREPVLRRLLPDGARVRIRAAARSEHRVHRAGRCSPTREPACSPIQSWSRTVATPRSSSRGSSRWRRWAAWARTSGASSVDGGARRTPPQRRLRVDRSPGATARRCGSCVQSDACSRAPADSSPACWRRPRTRDGCSSMRGQHREDLLERVREARKRLAGARERLATGVREGAREAGPARRASGVSADREPGALHSPAATHGRRGTGGPRSAARRAARRGGACFPLIEQRIVAELDALRSRDRVLDARHSTADARASLLEAVGDEGDELSDLDAALQQHTALRTEAMQARAAAIDRLVGLVEVRGGDGPAIGWCSVAAGSALREGGRPDGERAARGAAVRRAAVAPAVWSSSMSS